jgi:hypothetical protein
MLLARQLRAVPIEQGEILEERGERIDAIHFPQTGMISLIVENAGRSLRRSGNSWFGGRNRADNGIRIANWFCQRSCPSIWHLLVYACFPVSHRCSAKPTYS